MAHPPQDPRSDPVMPASERYETPRLRGAPGLWPVAVGLVWVVGAAVLAPSAPLLLAGFAVMAAGLALLVLDRRAIRRSAPRSRGRRPGARRRPSP